MAAVHPPHQQNPVFDDQLYRLIADTIPHMVWTARADGATDYQNHRVFEYTGLDASRLAGWGWKSVVHPEDWERCLAAWTQALEKRERYEVEYRLRRADGAYRWHRASAVPQRLQSAGDQIAAPRLDAMAVLVETTIDAIRGVMTDLRPAALEDFGLVPALRWYASQFSKRTGIKVATKASRRELRLPPDTELALFRIVQEALTNAAKHSGGTSVEIRIRYGERVKLTVQDDGRGFSEPMGARAAGRAGFGLTTMRERAEAHGGRLRVEFPGRGTRIVVELPRQVDIPVSGHDD